jgi:3,4-dihydroxy 2-butanone 4-phosphate synthase / GTP cyclohydrolase II
MSGLYSEARLPTVVGMFRLRVYEQACDSGPTAIIAGDRIAFATPTPARVHIACFLSENLGYVGCDCRERLSFALETIAAHGGVVVYLRRDSARRGVGEEIRRRGQVFTGHGVLDASSAAQAAEVFRDLGISSVRLIGGDGGQADALAACGIAVAEHLPAGPPAAACPLDLVGTFGLTSPQMPLADGAAGSE